MTSSAPNVSSDLNFKLLGVLLRPVVRFCLKRGILLQQFLSILKSVYLEVAEEQLSTITNKINISRLSVMTGVHRTDAMRLYRKRESPLPEEPITFVGRIIAHWTKNSQFITATRKPRVLTYGGEDSEFFRLVRSVSLSLNPATVLFELERSGTIKKVRKGIKLVRETTILSAREEQAYELLASDIDNLTTAFEENMSLSTGNLGNLHHRTRYDNIFIKDLPKIRTWILNRGRRFHKEVRDYLSEFDKDTTPKINASEPAGGVVQVSSFSYMSPAER